MAKKKFKAVVVFGEDAAKAYANGDMKHMYGLIRNCDGSLLQREFDTEAERKAYIMGIDDMDGWFGAAVLSEDDAKKKTVKELLKE